MALEERPLGIVIALIGVAGAAIAALADPLGLGEGHVFGWLQITGVLIGAAVALLGLALAMEWMPYRGRSGSTSTVTQRGQNTTVVRDTKPPEERTAP
jgi:hypothetical protein